MHKPLFFAVLGLAVGFGLYLELINRALSYMRHRISKPVVSLVMLVLLMGGFTWLGYAGGVTGGWLVILGFIGLIAAETHLRFMRRRHIGAPPVSRSGPPPSFFHAITTTDLTQLHYILPETRHDPSRYQTQQCAHR